MAERLTRQRREYDEQITDLEVKINHLEQTLTDERRRNARLEAKLQILATILQDHTA